MAKPTSALWAAYAFFFILAIKYTGFDNGTITWNIDQGKDFIMVSMSDDIDGKIQANDKWWRFSK